MGSAPGKFVICPGSLIIAVRVYGDAAGIRYRSQLDIVVQGRHIPRGGIGIPTL